VFVPGRATGALSGVSGWGLELHVAAGLGGGMRGFAWAGVPVSIDKRNFNPRHEDGWCRWCGSRIPYLVSQKSARSHAPALVGIRGAGVCATYTTKFCTGACAARYAELCLSRGHLYRYIPK
jgi:hypothetical protein